GGTGVESTTPVAVSSARSCPNEPSATAAPAEAPRKCLRSILAMAGPRMRNVAPLSDPHYSEIPPATQASVKFIAPGLVLAFPHRSHPLAKAVLRQRRALDPLRDLFGAHAAIEHLAFEFHVQAMALNVANQIQHNRRQGNQNACRAADADNHQHEALF